MGHLPNSEYIPDWNCNRAATIKANLASGSPILVSTGGGITLSLSLGQWAEWTCSSIDIVSVHDYGTDAATSVPALTAGQKEAKSNGKTLVFEEWGASGDNKASIIGSFLPALANAGIPHLIWEIVDPVCVFPETLPSDIRLNSSLTRVLVQTTLRFGPMRIHIQSSNKLFRTIPSVLLSLQSMLLCMSMLLQTKWQLPYTEEAACSGPTVVRSENAVLLPKLEKPLPVLPKDFQLLLLQLLLLLSIMRCEQDIFR